MKNIAILGSTGSIGRQTLEVIAAHPDEFKIIALGCQSSTELLLEQIKQFRPLYVAVSDEKKGRELKNKLKDKKIKVYVGCDAMEKIAVVEGVEMVVVSVVGAAGIRPTLAAIRAGKNIGLATKEVMVCAGDLINQEAEQYNVKLMPIDSEHSAVFQCLSGTSEKTVNKIYLTCSGGSFRGKKKVDLETASPEQALKHPNWTMGPKITIDCATLMNKGLEVIEAQKLFKIEIDKIKVLIHPQSIIHSMVEFVDGTVIAQLGPKDMRIPIRYALSYPDRLNNHFPFLDPFSMEGLTFSSPDTKTFECLEMAYEAGRIGGTLPVVLNAADEVAVNLFLNKKIKFLEIPAIVKKVMLEHKVVSNPDIDQITIADNWARSRVF